MVPPAVFTAYFAFLVSKLVTVVLSSDTKRRLAQNKLSRQGRFGISLLEGKTQLGFNERQKVSTSGCNARLLKIGRAHV